MTYMWLKNKYRNTSRDTMKIVEHWHLTTLWQACSPQSQNYSCIWRWKWLFIFMLKCLLLTNSSVKHSLSIYLLIIIIIIIIYFCSYNTGWDEKQVLFTRLIIILLYGTHLHSNPDRKSSSKYHVCKKILCPQLLNNHCCFSSIYQQSCCCGCGFFGWCCAGHGITWDDLIHMLLYYLFCVSLSYHMFNSAKPKKVEAVHHPSLPLVLWQ